MLDFQVPIIVASKTDFTIFNEHYILSESNPKQSCNMWGMMRSRSTRLMS